MAQELIARYCRQGDQEAFRRFYLEEAPRLWKLLVARGCSADDAYDLVADAFLRFVSSVCQDPSFPRALLYRIALNARIDLIRREKVRATSEDSESVLAEVPARCPDPVEELVVRRAMSRLQADEQNLLQLRYWVGLTHAEIAAALARPEGTVRRQCAAALQRMRALLAAEAEPAGKNSAGR